MKEGSVISDSKEDEVLPSCCKTENEEQNKVRRDFYLFLKDGIYREALRLLEEDLEREVGKEYLSAGVIKVLSPSAYRYRLLGVLFTGRGLYDKDERGKGILQIARELGDTLAVRLLEEMPKKGDAKSWASKVKIEKSSDIRLEKT